MHKHSERPGESKTQASLEQTHDSPQITLQVGFMKFLLSTILVTASTKLSFTFGTGHQLRSRSYRLDPSFGHNCREMAI